MTDEHLPRSRAAVPRLVAEVVAGQLESLGPEAAAERRLERVLAAMRANGFGPEIDLFLAELSDELLSMQSRAADGEHAEACRRAADVVANHRASQLVR